MCKKPLKYHVTHRMRLHRKHDHLTTDSPTEQCANSKRHSSPPDPRKHLPDPFGPSLAVVLETNRRLLKAGNETQLVWRGATKINGHCFFPDDDAAGLDVH